MNMGHPATTHRATEDGREPGASFPVPVEDVPVNTMPCLSNCEWHFVQGAPDKSSVQDDLVQIWFTFSRC